MQLFFRVRTDWIAFGSLSGSVRCLSFFLRSALVDFVRASLQFFDHPAGNLLPRVSRGLGMKIVRVSMDDDRPADDFLHPETSGQHFQIGFSIITQQRWKIPCVIWVFSSAGIKMTACTREAVPAAASSLVNVKRKESSFRFGQTGYGCLHKHTVMPLDKCDCSPNHRIISASEDACSGFWMYCLLHRITPSRLCNTGVFALIFELAEVPNELLIKNSKGQLRYYQSDVYSTIKKLGSTIVGAKHISNFELIFIW